MFCRKYCLDDWEKKLLGVTFEYKYDGVGRVGMLEYLAPLKSSNLANSNAEPRSILLSDFTILDLYNRFIIYS